MSRCQGRGMERGLVVGLFFLAVLAILSSSVHAGLLSATNCGFLSNVCYQENATNSTSCGAVGGGSYVLYNSLNTAYMNVTYVKPAGAVSASWQVKHGLLSTYNVTIPSGCFDANATQLLVRMSGGGWPSAISYGECFNGSSWILVTNISSEPAPSGSMNRTLDEDNVSLRDGNYATYSCGVYLLNSSFDRVGSFWSSICNTVSGNRWYDEGIYWTMSGLTCLDTAKIQCDVSDTNGGLPPVEATGVTFTVNGQQYSASIMSGNGVNGTWRANVSANGLATDSLTISSIAVTDSIGTVCSMIPTETNKVSQSSTCYVSFTKPLTQGVSCSCQTLVNQTQIVGYPNTCQTTWTPTTGCADQTVRTSASTCDWCTPGWQEYYTTCQVNRSSSSPFLGVSTKKYRGNQSCCEMTRLPEDCNAPVDADITIPCVMDYCATGGGDALGTNHAQQDNTLLNPVEYNTTISAAEQYPGGPMVKPLVFDVNGDGITEIMIFENVSGVANIRMYIDPKLATVWKRLNLTTPNGLVQLRGQPSLYGFGAYGKGKYVWDAGLQAGTYGVGLAGIVHDVTLNKDVFGTWRWENDTFVWKSGFNLDVQGIQGGVGVNCFANDCYFMDNNGTLYVADAPYTTVTKRTASQMGVLVPVNTYVMNSLPVLVVFNDTVIPTVLAVEGFQRIGGQDKATLFLCDVNTLACTNYVFSGIEAGNLSRLAVGVPVNGVAPIFITSYESTVTPGVYDTGRIWMVKVNETLGFVKVSNMVVSATGGILKRLSDPATAVCVGGGTGAAIASHWVNGPSEYTEYACYTMS